MLCIPQLPSGHGFVSQPLQLHTEEDYCVSSEREWHCRPPGQAEEQGQFNGQLGWKWGGRGGWPGHQSAMRFLSRIIYEASQCTLILQTPSLRGRGWMKANFYKTPWTIKMWPRNIFPNSLSLGYTEVRSSGQILQPFLLTVALSDRALRCQQAELTCSTWTVCPLQKRAQWCMWSCWITFQLGPTSRRQRVFMRCTASVERQVSQPSVHCAGLSLKHGCQRWASGLRMLPSLLFTYIMVLKKIIRGLGTARYKHTGFKRQCFDTAQLQLYILDTWKNNWVLKK